MSSTLYQQLDIDPKASAEQITAAYLRERAKLYAAGDAADPEISNALEVLNEAYRILSDPTSRIMYDRSLGISLNSDTALVPAQRINPPTPFVEAPAVSTGSQRECSNCGTLNPGQLMMCVVCGAQIGRPCPRCGHTIALNQPICDRCATPIAEYDRQRYSEATAVEQRIQKDRRVAEAHQEALEKINSSDSRNTTLFWILVVFGCALLTFLAYYALRFFDNTF